MLVGIVGSSVGYVVQDLLFIEVVALGDRYKSLRSERTFTVDVHGFAFTTTLISRHLTRDAESMTKLGFPSAKLTK